jgi:hypothetical protein
VASAWAQASVPEGVEPVDRDLGRPLRQAREPAADPADDRGLEILVHRQQRGDLVHPLHGRERLEPPLALDQLLPRVGDRERVPHALVALLEQLLLHGHALQAVGLHVEQVVVVGKLRQAAEHRERAGQAGHGHEPRVPEHRPQPGVHRHGLGQPAAQAAAVHERQHRRQDADLREAAEQDAAARDHAEFRDAHEARERRAEEGHGRGDRAGEDAGADRGARLQERRVAAEAAPAGLEVAADVVGAVVDAHADHRHGEGDAEDVQVADAGRGPGEGPGHADHEHAVGHQRMPEAAEARGDHHHHGRERQPARPEHRLLARPHLVVFHHRQPGQADRDPGVPAADRGDDPAELVRGRRRAGEAAVLLDEPQEHEPQPAVLRQQVLAGEVAERGQRVGHAGPGGAVVRRGVGAGGRLDGREQRLGVALERRQRLLVAGGGAGRAAHHLGRQPGHHRAHLELAPAAVEHRLGPLEERLDPLEVRRRDVVQALGADPRQVDLVQHRAEQPRLPAHLPRQFAEHADHARPRGSLDDDHRVVVVAELPQVVDPELVVFAVGVEQVDAADLVAQVPRAPQSRGHRRERRQEHDGQREPQAEVRPADERAADEPRGPRAGRLRRPGPGRRRMMNPQHGGTAGTGGRRGAGS